MGVQGTTEARDAEHSHNWAYEYHFPKASSFGHSIAKCDCGVLRLDTKGDGEVSSGITYISEAESNLLVGIGREFAKDNERRLANRADKAEARVSELEQSESTELARARRRVRELEDEQGELGGRVDALEEAGAQLVGALTEYGDTPWWLRAAAAFNELHRLAVEKDGV